MKRYELIVQGAEVVLPGAVLTLDVGVRGGRIAALGESLDPAEAAVVRDASGLHLFPGMVDAHVHFNEPNFGHWEGFRSGSAALATGGCSSYIDMPLNGNPPTVTARALRQKAELARGQSAVDYAFWGGLVPGNERELAPMAEAGAVAFKAFLSNPGGEGEGRFREVDDWTLYEGMGRIAEFGGLLALHAESDGMTAALVERMRAAGRGSARDYAASRPPEAEDRKSTRLNSSHIQKSRMPSSA